MLPFGFGYHWLSLASISAVNCRKWPFGCVHTRCQTVAQVDHACCDDGLLGGRYAGAESVYTHTVAYERDQDCMECSPTETLRVSPSDTLQQV